MQFCLWKTVWLIQTLFHIKSIISSHKDIYVVKWLRIFHDSCKYMCICLEQGILEIGPCFIAKVTFLFKQLWKNNFSPDLDNKTCKPSPYELTDRQFEFKGIKEIEDIYGWASKFISFCEYQMLKFSLVTLSGAHKRKKTFSFYVCVFVCVRAYFVPKIGGPL